MNTIKKLMTLVLVMLALTACKDDGEVVYMLPEKKPIQLSAEQKQLSLHGGCSRPCRSRKARSALCFHPSA